MTTIPAFFLQDDSGIGAGGMMALGGIMIVYMVVLVVAIVAMWKVFTKAGQPGWAILIPIYNMYILTKIAGKPGWWVVLMLIPFVNIVILLLLAIDIAKAFGKSTAFGIVGLFLFSIIGYLILGFGSARYVGPAAPAVA
jgi:Family of unknown function (DUF5684)